MDWILTEDRLPEDGDKCLLHTVDDEYVAAECCHDMDGCRWAWDISTLYTPDVTHWTLISEVP